MIISWWNKAVLILKNKHFVDFHSKNILIFSKFLDFVMLGTGDIGQNGEKFKFFYHLHKQSYMPYIVLGVRISKWH
jgi:hypothetical protein